MSSGTNPDPQRHKKSVCITGLIAAMLTSSTYACGPSDTGDNGKRVMAATSPQGARGGASADSTASGADSWTLAVMPDTQYYASDYPETFDAQTSWLVEHDSSLCIKHVVHVGDIVNLDEEDQWQNASHSMHMLDGHIPYSILPGNHDYQGEGYVSSRSSMINEYFAVSDIQSWAQSSIETYQDGAIENTVHLFDVGGRSYIIVSLEFGPRDSVVEWARDMLALHANSFGIVATHAHLDYEASRYDWAAKGEAQSFSPHGLLDKLGEPVNDGQELWDRLIAVSPNVRLVLSGHSSVGRNVGTRENAPAIYELTSTYHDEPNGGDGWLRLLEFRKDSIFVRTYSPTRDEYRTDDANQFELTL